jgi:hypothetical protein
MGLRQAVKPYIGDFHGGYKGASPVKFQNPESYPPHKPARPHQLVLATQLGAIPRRCFPPRDNDNDDDNIATGCNNEDDVE